MFREEVCNIIDNKGQKLSSLSCKDPAAFGTFRLIDKLEDVALDKVLFQLQHLIQRAAQFFFGDWFEQVVDGVELKAFQEVLVVSRCENYREAHGMLAKNLEGMIVG